MTTASESVRILTDDWVHPLPIESLFPEPHPIEVDLGCGKGRFLLARAAAKPDTNFLGIDRMLRRIRKVDRKAVRAGLNNVRLLRIEGYYATVYLLPPRSVRAFYIFFPDPWPKARHHKNRLFDAQFLDALDRTLVADGIVHVATDHLPYFEDIAALLDRDPRFTPTDPFVPEEEEKTDFELLFRDQPIGRCSVRRRGD